MNPVNNKNIAIAAKAVLDFHVTQEDLSGTFDDTADIENDGDWAMVTIRDQDEAEKNELLADFDSPMATLLRSSPALEGREYPTRRPAAVGWGFNTMAAKDVTAMCISAHPTKEQFVSGDTSGNLHLYDFGTNRARNAIRLTENIIEEVHYSPCGDRLLAVTSRGEVFMTDFSGGIHASWDAGGGAAAKWLNSDTQVVVTSQGRAQAMVVDALSGRGAVLSFGSVSHPMAAPVAVWGPKVGVGLGDGSVAVYDVRTGGQLAHVRGLHRDPVRAIEFDYSGSFFVTGSTDDSICVVEAESFGSPVVLDNALGSSNAVSKRGVTCLGLSNQIIVAGGYSSKLHAWAVSEPQANLYL